MLLLCDMFGYQSGPVATSQAGLVDASVTMQEKGMLGHDILNI